MSRRIRHVLLLVVLLALTASDTIAAEGFCIPNARITGYSRYAFSSHTADGTHILSPEPIAAASWNIPLGWFVRVDGLGVYRVADRGHLGNEGWVDIATWDLATAYAITSTRTICVSPSPEGL